MFRARFAKGPPDSNCSNLGLYNEMRSAPKKIGEVENLTNGRNIEDVQGTTLITNERRDNSSAFFG